MNGQGISAMVFSTDETTNKAVVCAGVPEMGDKGKHLEVSEWLTAALEPLKGRCGKGKGGLASGQVSNFYMVPAVNRSHLKLSTW
jgi:alanyl-tRNA synthetase